MKSTLTLELAAVQEVIQLEREAFQQAAANLCKRLQHQGLVVKGLSLDLDTLTEKRNGTSVLIEALVTGSSVTVQHIATGMTVKC